MECEKKQYQLQAVCFAASTGVVIACLEGTIVKSFMEQLRVWMFLALNLLLLAILFTSTNPTLLHAKSEQKQTNASEEKLKVEESNEEEDCKLEMVCIEDEKNQENCKKVRVVEFELMGHEENAEKIIECDLKCEESGEVEMKEEEFQLSKEELNEKVEAFIAMFKQHLRSDAKGRSCRQFHSSLSKNSGRLNVMPKHFR
ncbi:hypothetical protein Leryth_005650 [Lithospermum erythrorhizon]|uniref:Uncharacterized protein n=1 Tax=Lithospermum erythrorhizon TaxID=34254 RepID=A0AAV3RGM5_LITER|nr:hypothetical protein Leryth_005650 [Lithospermum erythrorhizon]